MIFDHKEPNIQYLNVNNNGKNWIVPVQRMTPRRTFLEKHFPLIAVAVFVGLSTLLLIGAVG